MTRCVKWNANEEFNAPNEGMRALNEEQVDRLFISSVLLLINEVGLSIYRFLVESQKCQKVASIDQVGSQSID